MTPTWLPTFEEQVDALLASGKNESAKRFIDEFNILNPDGDKTSGPDITGMPTDAVSFDMYPIVPDASAAAEREAINTARNQRCEDDSCTEDCYRCGSHKGLYMASYENVDPNYEIIIESPLTKLADFLYYEIIDGELDLAYANAYAKRKYQTGSACSEVRNGKFYGRNYDWNYDYAVTTVVRTMPLADRFASIGVAGFFTVTEKEISGNKNTDGYTILPCHMLDGINECGVACGSNVVPAMHTSVDVDGEKVPFSGETKLGEDGKSVVPFSCLTTGTAPGKKPLFAMFVVRYILDHATSADHAIELLKERNIYALHNDTMVDEFHWMISDSDHTYVVEIVNNELSIIEKFVDDKPIMTNFYLTDWDGSRESFTLHACGIERYDILAAGFDSVDSVESMADLMHQVQYTKAYDLTQDPIWYSESYSDYGPLGDLNIYSTPEEMQVALDVTAERFANRSRETAETWQTVHTSVYDLEKKTLRLNVQELEKYYEFSLFENGDDPDEPKKETQPNNEIWYTTTTHKSFKDQAVFNPMFEDFNANLVSDVYDTAADKGILKFDRDLTIWDCSAWEWDNVYYVDTMSLPASLKQFGSYGYIHRWPITSITFLSETPLDLGGASLDDKINAVYDDLVIYVPADAVEAYKAAWPEFADRITAIR